MVGVRELVREQLGRRLLARKLLVEVARLLVLLEMLRLLVLVLVLPLLLVEVLLGQLLGDLGTEMVLVVLRVAMQLFVG